MRVLSVGLALAWAVSPLVARAQTPVCTLQKNVYTCDRAQFQRVLRTATTARVEVSAQDRMVGAKLRDLVVSLGKTVAGAEEKADLTFALSALNTEGVMVGPAGVELAVLKVSGADGSLLWAETYRGQPDMSWPAVVQATIQQFRAGMKR